MRQSPSYWPLVYLGLAFTTLATLLLELALTRIFSVVFFYHFAFLAISIALFGLGAGGVFSYLVAGWPGRFFAKLGALSAGTSLLVAASLVFALTRHENPGGWTLAAMYFATALPFFLAGATVSLAIAETLERVDRVYFYDLMGAAAGCLLLIPFLNYFGGPNTVLLAAALYAVSAAIWCNLAGAARGRVLAVGLALGMVAVVAFNAKSPFVDVRYAKGKVLDNEQFVKWNSFSRIAVAPEKGSGMMLIVIDADASTGIANFNFDKLTPEERRDLLTQGPGLCYAVRPGGKTLIIGPGGGWDVARALASGSREVTGVEINPIIARTIMRERMPHLSQRLYFRPEVRIEVEDARSFIRRSPEKYQVLQATLVDTWAATAAGAYALSENNLYTTEAFVEYLNHLTDDGLMAFTRWGLEPPRESLRLISLAMEALARVGERAPWRHVIVGREGTSEQLAGWGVLDTVLVARRPFSAGDVERARRALQAPRMQAIYLPGDRPSNPFGELLTSPDPQEYRRRYPYDISPVSDDRPFFFYSVQPQDLWEFVRRASRLTADYKINRAVPLLFQLVGISLLATTVILALPPVILRSHLPRERGVAGYLLYFVAIGVGYILIEVALIQRFVLFLGHPTYALTVIVFSMLVSSGLGSFWSRRWMNGSERRLQWTLALIALGVLALAYLAAPLTTAAVGWPLVLKFGATAGLIAPLGFLMGMPFPVGLLRLENRYPASVRWAWALNAAASVLGSASAIFLALYLGLRNTLLVGGALYLCALALARLTGSAAARRGEARRQAESLTPQPPG